MLYDRRELTVLSSAAATYKGHALEDDLQYIPIIWLRNWFTLHGTSSSPSATGKVVASEYLAGRKEGPRVMLEDAQTPLAESAMTHQQFVCLKLNKIEYKKDVSAPICEPLNYAVSSWSE